MGRCFSSKADMPMTCFCQEVGIKASESDIALYIFQVVSRSTSSPHAKIKLVCTATEDSTNALTWCKEKKAYLGHRNTDGNKH